MTERRGFDLHGGDRPRPHRGRWTSRPDLVERWSSRLVATASEDRLSTAGGDRGPKLLGESPSASFPFDGPESTRAISTVSPSVRPRNSQSRVTPGNLRTIRSAISLLSGAPHSTLFHLPRSTPRSSANFCWSPRPLKPIASRKRRARFDSSLPGKLQSTTSLRTIKSGNSKIVPRQCRVIFCSHNTARHVVRLLAIESGMPPNITPAMRFSCDAVV